jgi:hypothetical protein
MITIAILTAVFGIGLIAGLVALVRVGIAREEHDRSLLDQPPTLAVALTRRIVGLYVRTPHGSPATLTQPRSSSPNVTSSPV